MFNNKHLIPAKDGQLFPAWGGQGLWLFQHREENNKIRYLKFRMVLTTTDLCLNLNGLF